MDDIETDVYKLDGFTSVAVFQHKDLHLIVNYSETQKQIKINLLDSEQSYKQANPIMKIYKKDDFIYILDVLGGVQMLDLQEKTQTEI